MRATLSIRGLTKHNPEIWDHFVIPTGLSKQDIIDSICLEFADLELLYPDAEVMEDAIGLWSRRELPIWEKLYDTTKFEYNPIHNVDYSETEDHTVNDENSSNTTSSGTSSSSGSDSNTTTNRATTLDSGTMIDGTQQVYSGESENEGSSSSQGTSASSHDREEATTRHKVGNMGVASTQSLIKEEREVDDFDIEEIIIGSFKARFCLMIY